VPKSILKTKALSYRVALSPPNDSTTRVLLRNIDIEVNSGEIFSLTGHSGAGKSTLLKLLCRLLEPSEGEIFFNGENILEMNPRSLRREVVLVFQSPVLMGKKVREDLALGFNFATDGYPSLPTEATWAEKLLEKVHLPTKFLEEDPKNLSLGEAHRVALARALAIQPKVLLLDEPTASLDPVSKQVIEEVLHEASSQGTSIVLVTHDLSQAERLAPHGIELINGEIGKTW